MKVHMLTAEEEGEEEMAARATCRLELKSRVLPKTVTPLRSTDARRPATRMSYRKGGGEDEFVRGEGARQEE